MELKEKVKAVRALKEGGPDSGNFGHSGRPGEVGGSGPGGGGVKSASGGTDLTPGVGKFDWKRRGNTGSYLVRLRFSDADRGEKYFDSKFGVREGDSKKGQIRIQGQVAYGGAAGPTAKEAGLNMAIKKGDTIQLTASWVSPRGEKAVDQFSVKVKDVKEVDDEVVFTYDEIRAMPTPVKSSQQWENAKEINMSTLAGKVAAIREAAKESEANSIKIGDKSYAVAPEVTKLLDGEGIHYLDGEEKKGPKGESIFVTYVKTLKRSDSDFEKMFSDIYDTVAGEMLLKDGIDIEGVNPSLKQPE